MIFLKGFFFSHWMKIVLTMIYIKNSEFILNFTSFKKNLFNPHCNNSKKPYQGQQKNTTYLICTYKGKILQSDSFPVRHSAYFENLFFSFVSLLLCFSLLYFTLLSLYLIWEESPEVLFTRWRPLLLTANTYRDLTSIPPDSSRKKVNHSFLESTREVLYYDVV